MHRSADHIPAYCLHAIVFVDNDNNFRDLKGELENNVQKYLAGKSKVLRTTTHEGLIWERKTGAAHATGEAWVSLDNHCEVNVMWLQPLLAPPGGPAEHGYHCGHTHLCWSPTVQGGFSWGLHCKWDLVPC